VRLYIFKGIPHTIDRENGMKPIRINVAAHSQQDAEQMALSAYVVLRVEFVKDEPIEVVRY
jgi:hypothetical protein